MIFLSLCLFSEELMPLFELDAKKVLYIHIPKCGGTSIEDSLKSVSSSYNLYSSKKVKGFPCTPQHFHREMIDHIFPDIGSYYLFTVVRHPILRFISEYRYRKKNNPSLQFTEFLILALEKYNQDSYWCDNHIRPQVEFLNKNTEVFKLEDGLGKCLEKVHKVLGSKNVNSVKKLNSTESSNERFDGADINKVLNFYSLDMTYLGYRVQGVISDKQYTYDEIVSLSISDDVDINSNLIVNKLDEKRLKIGGSMANSNDQLTQSEVNIIRDASVLLENENVVQSLKLMKIAQRFRPNGPFINKKVTEYQDRSKYEANQDVIDKKDNFNNADSHSRIADMGHRKFVGGGDAEAWYGIGMLQYNTLLRYGLKPNHKFLDIACGSLRLGQFLIPYLDKSRYFGLDAEPKLVEQGLKHEVADYFVDVKNPKFDFNFNFDFSFIDNFDFSMAQSLFTHLTPNDIRKCLLNLRPLAHKNSKFLFTFFEGDSSRNIYKNSHANRDWYYSREEIESFGRDSGWDIEYVGDWNHPRNQKLCIATLE